MATSITIPRRLPLLIVGENVLLPGSSMRIAVRTLRNMNMVKSRLLSKSTLSSTIIGVVPKEPGEESEDLLSMHHIGTAAVVVQVTGTNWPKPAYTILVTGLCRFKTEQLLQESPYPVASVTQLDKLEMEDSESTIKASADLTNLADNFRDQAAKLVEMLDISIPVVAKLKKMLDSLPSQHLPDVCASIIKASYAEKVQVLDAVDLTDRFKKTLPLLIRQIEGLEMLQKAKKNNRDIVVNPSKVRRMIPGKGTSKGFNMDDEDDGDGDEIGELEQKIRNAAMPDQALKAAQKELKRLKKMPQQMPEHAMIRNYLELMIDLPWSKSSTDTLDIVRARTDLDADHYGLDKVKKRIIEYLAVRQIKNSLKGPILCFVGPPGVGKTSIGKSVAQTLGRKFHRIALGGICDQSDIRGHRRTYIGSMPGRIVQGLKQVETNNPVILLDEIDKLGKSLHGDPAAALLEVLDPEQNHTFTDHYLNVPFDLSQVLFIATANSMSTIPAPLLDRMEVLQISGYTQEEKVNITVRHLVPKQLSLHGLTDHDLQIPADSLKTVVSKYTREAGVRTLERRIGAVCRAVAVKVAEKKSSEKVESNLNKEILEVSDKDTATTVSLSHPPELPIIIDENAIEDILGPPVFEMQTSERLSHPGVAVGLAWTPMGGEIMFVEATKMVGDGQLVLTGQLGDVMKESANIALSWIRGNLAKIGLSQSTELLKKTDIHIHFPAGAVGKDGPSAGVTIVTVLVSLFTQTCVRSDVAMTGEVTLRGLVLPVGGIKDKVLAAHRAGLRRIILPKKNAKDLLEIPDSVKNDLTFIPVARLEDVLQAAIDGEFPQMKEDDSAKDVISKL